MIVLIIKRLIHIQSNCVVSCVLCNTSKSNKQEYFFKDHYVYTIHIMGIFDDIISELYYDKKQGFTSVTKLYKKLKAIDDKIR